MKNEDCHCFQCLQPESDPFDTPEYAEFVESMVKHCHCCPECSSDIPCAGVLSGGLCDGACNCDDDAYWIGLDSRCPDEDE